MEAAHLLAAQNLTVNSSAAAGHDIASPTLVLAVK